MTTQSKLVRYYLVLLAFATIVWRWQWTIGVGIWLLAFGVMFLSIRYWLYEDKRPIRKPIIRKGW